MFRGVNWNPGATLLWSVAGIVLLIAVAVLPALGLKAYCSTDYSQQPIAYHITEDGEQSKYASPQTSEPPISIFSFGKSGLGLPSTIHRSETADYSAQEPNAFGRRFFCEINGADYTLALFTVLLALSTVILSFATLRAASAAQNAAEALPKLERAYVFAKSLTTNSIPSERVVQQDASIHMIFLTYAFKNHGRTPAILQDMRISAGYLLEAPPIDTSDGEKMPAPIVVSAGDDWPNNTYKFPLAGYDFNRATAGNGFIFCWGKLGYQDIFEKRHEVGFCSQWDFDSQRFVVTKSDRLNYYD